MFFVETTVINRLPFEEAKRIGKEKFKNNFLFIGTTNPMPNDLTYFSKGCQIIDLYSVRSEGIISRRG